MSRPTSVLADFLAAGASISVDDGHLVIDAEPGKVTREMLQDLAEHKSEILQMIKEDRGVPTADWEAAALNRLFQEQGVTGERGRITAATVKHGERQIHNHVLPAAPDPPRPIDVVGLTRPPSGDADPRTQQQKDAVALLNRTGVRIMRLDGGTAIGVWSDLDGPEIREALRILGHALLPVRYLEGAGIPARYTSRDVPGKSVPPDVLANMEPNPEPWVIRDLLLSLGDMFPVRRPRPAVGDSC